MSLGSHIRYLASSQVLAHGLITCLLLICSLPGLNACKCVSVHIQVRVIPCRPGRIAAVVAKFGTNLDKSFTIAMNSCNCLLSPCYGKSKIVCTLSGSAESPSGVKMCTSMSKLLLKNWHLLSFNQNCWSGRRCRAFHKASTCCL